MPTRKPFPEFIERILMDSEIKIGDLVALDPEFKKYNYKKGTAPLFQWSIGWHGHITKGTITDSNTAVVLDIRLYIVEDNIKLRSYKLLVDNGIEGWFCEDFGSLIKKN